MIESKSRDESFPRQDAKRELFQQMSLFRSPQVAIPPPSLGLPSIAGGRSYRFYRNIASELYEDGVALRQLFLWSFDSCRWFNTLSPRSLGVIVSFLSGLRIVVTNNPSQEEGMTATELQGILFINVVIWAGILFSACNRNNRVDLLEAEDEVEEAGFSLEI